MSSSGVTHRYIGKEMFTAAQATTENLSLLPPAAINYLQILREGWSLVNHHAPSNCLINFRKSFNLFSCWNYD